MKVSRTIVQPSDSRHTSRNARLLNSGNTRAATLAGLAARNTVLPFGAAVQKLLDEEFLDGQRYYTKEAHVAELAGEAIDALVEFWKDMPMHGEVEIIGLGGAIGDALSIDAVMKLVWPLLGMLLLGLGIWTYRTLLK